MSGLALEGFLGGDEPTEEEAQPLPGVSTDDMVAGEGLIELPPQQIQLPEPAPEPLTPPDPTDPGEVGGETEIMPAMLGAPEAATTMGTGLVSTAAGGLLGLGQFVASGGDEQRAVDTVAAIQDLFTYQPRTAHGAQILQTLEDFTEPLTTAQDWAANTAGDAAFEATGSPAAATAAYVTPAFLEFLLGGLFGRAIQNGSDSTQRAAEVIKEVADAPDPYTAGVVAEDRLYNEGVSWPTEEPQAQPELETAAPPPRESRVMVPGEPPPSADVKADLYHKIPSNDTAFRKIEDPTLPYDQQRVVRDFAAHDASKYLPEGSLASIKASNKPTRDAMRRSLDELDKGMRNDTYAADHRPADVSGNVVMDAVDYLKDVMNTAARQLDRVAKDLVGVPVDLSKAQYNFLDELERLNVRYDATEGELYAPRNSQLEDMPELLNQLNAVFERISRQDMDGFGAHNLKRWIDKRVQYDKTSGQGYVADVERIIKNVRHDINQELRRVSPEYGRINQQYSETRSVLDELQRVVGKNTDFEGENIDAQMAGYLRRLLSNAQSRIPIRDAVVAAHRTAQKYGNTSELSQVNLPALLMFISRLEENFGSAAPTSFMHEIQKAGMATARAKGGDVFGALDLGKQAMEMLNLRSPEEGMTLIRDYLDELDARESAAQP